MSIVIAQFAVELLWLKGRASKYRVCGPEVRFLTGTQNVYFVLQMIKKRQLHPHINLSSYQDFITIKEPLFCVIRFCFIFLGVLRVTRTWSTTPCCVQDLIRVESMLARAIVAVRWSVNTMADGSWKELLVGVMDALALWSTVCTQKYVTSRAGSIRSWGATESSAICTSSEVMSNQIKFNDWPCI